MSELVEVLRKHTETLESGMNRHLVAVEKQMEQGFKIIASEMKQAIAERDTRILEKMSESCVQIAQLRQDAERKSDEIQILFNKSDQVVKDINCIINTQAAHAGNLEALLRNTAELRELNKSVHQQEGKETIKSLFLPIAATILIAIIGFAVAQAVK